MKRPPRRKQSPPQTADRPAASGDRLQKVLAAAGLGSRRDCEELIASGRVEVDGAIVSELGVRVDPSRQTIRVDGVTLPRPKRVYFALHKPVGVLCTNDDPSGRMRAVDLVRSDERLFTVGRLDRTSEGLILITNDGDLAHRLTHPRFGVEKRYLARVVGNPNPTVLAKLRSGVRLAEGMARVSDIRVRKATSRFADLEIVLQEGRNREIRRLLARVGHKVVRLKRIAVGPVRLGELPSGEYRSLTREEVRKLQEVATTARRPARGQKKRGPESVRRAEGRPASRSESSARPRPVRPQPPVVEPAEIEVKELPPATSPGVVIGGDEMESTPRPSPPRSSQKRRRR